MPASSDCLEWESPFTTYPYEPLYLANTYFGGMLDLSGTDMNLWSSRIGGKPVNAEGHGETCYPVTAIRVQAHYRTPYLRERGFWCSAAGILTDVPGYTSDPSMPHQTQVYGCKQSLNLTTGIAETSGTVFLGSESAFKSGRFPERGIPFYTRVAFLKGSPQMGIAITVEEGNEILFDPLPVLEDRYVLDVTGKGIFNIGNEIKADIRVRQQILASQHDEHTITYTLQPEGNPAYTVIISTAGGRVSLFNQRPVIIAEKHAFITVQILTENETPATPPWAEKDFFLEQAKRWQAFWSRSAVCLPKSVALWQQRYRTSLFYVSQSVCDGPVHPVGLSQPMLPYWYGSFHDTDTYFCRPLLEAGHGGEALQHLNYRHRILKKAKSIAEDSGNCGALYPWESDMHGAGLLVNVPMNQAIIACEAWFQYCYTGCEKAKQQATDILAGVLENLLGYVERSEPHWTLKDIPILTFSETIEAHQPGEVIVALRATAACYLDAMRGMQEAALVADAQRVLKDFCLPEKNDGYAIVPQGDPEYLRCPSITLGSFPLHALEPDSRLARTYEKELHRIVSVFAWMPHQLSIVASQLQRTSGFGNAWEMLEQTEVFYKTWHAFDEWENRRAARAKIFVTAAGALCTAIHHLLIAETAPHCWTLFPGIPQDWKDVSFQRLRIRDGWTVSATLEQGNVVSFEATPTHTDAVATLTIFIPNPDANITINAPVKSNQLTPEALVLTLSPKIGLHG